MRGRLLVRGDNVVGYGAVNPLLFVCGEYNVDV